MGARTHGVPARASPSPGPAQQLPTARPGRLGQSERTEWGWGEGGGHSTQDPRARTQGCSQGRPSCAFPSTAAAADRQAPQPLGAGGRGQRGQQRGQGQGQAKNPSRSLIPRSEGFCRRWLQAHPGHGAKEPPRTSPRDGEISFLPARAPPLGLPAANGPGLSSLQRHDRLCPAVRLGRCPLSRKCARRSKQETATPRRCPAGGGAWPEARPCPPKSTGRRPCWGGQETKACGGFQVTPALSHQTFALAPRRIPGTN